MKAFFDDGYVAARHQFDTTRKSAVVAEAIRAGRVPGVDLVEPSDHLPAAEAAISEVHDATYVKALQTGEPDWLARGNGFPWDPGIWTMAIHSTAGILAAVDEAVATGGPSGSLSSGLHHARRDRGSGFCTVNGLAVAVHHVLDGEAAGVLGGAGTVAILDVDAHCGGGTESLVGADPRVVHLDLSTSGFDAYEPSGAGVLEVVRSDDGDYLAELDRMLDRLPDEAGLVLVNAGMDPHPGISFATLAERERRIAERCRRRPTAFVLAGGYTSSMSEERLVDLHLLTVEAMANLEPAASRAGRNCQTERVPRGLNGRRWTRRRDKKSEETSR